MTQMDLKSLFTNNVSLIGSLASIVIIVSIEMTGEMGGANNRFSPF